jgi:ABC-2 type transport system permease protein
MGRNFALFFHEWRQVALMPPFPILGTLFLVLESMLFFFVLQSFGHAPHFIRPTALWLQTFWVGALILVPLLTMRSVAEERARGTLDGLLSTSLSPFTVIACKFFALWANYLLLWGGALAIQRCVQWSAALPFPFMAAGECWGSVAFLAMAGALHISLGLLCSTLARSPTVAGTATFAVLLLLFFGPRFFGESAALARFPALRHFLGRQEIFPLLGEFTAGIFDSRTVLFHCSTAAAALICAALFLRRP